MSKKYKNILVSVALLGILSQSFEKFILFVSFELNRTFIAQNICIKKELPDNTCKGFCHLEKQLNNIEQTQDQSSTSSYPDDLNFKIDFNLWVQDISTLPRCLFLIAELKNKIKYSHYLMHYSLAFLVDIFSPPKK